jgi:uncharacterized protein YbaR (Trm112 family)
MKKSLVEILVCPTSKASLKLAVDDADGEEVIEGGLICPTCDHTFPITQGVPNLLPWDGCVASR